MFDAFLTPWTLLVKALGLALAVASGLSLGKEAGLCDIGLFPLTKTFLGSFSARSVLHGLLSFSTVQRVSTQ